VDDAPLVPVHAAGSVAATLAAAAATVAAEAAAEVVAAEAAARPARNCSRMSFITFANPSFID